MVHNSISPASKALAWATNIAVLGMIAYLTHLGRMVYDHEVQIRVIQSSVSIEIAGLKDQQSKLTQQVSRAADELNTLNTALSVHLGVEPSHPKAGGNQPSSTIARERY